eukprot:Nk52_evm3s2473 gene=Nk52_evmTU3s2473
MDENMDYGELLDCCAELLEKFNPLVVTVDDHLKTFILSKKVKNPNDQLFIKEVFSGCIRHERPIEVLINGFYNFDKSCMRADRGLYFSIAYLAIFRLNELGFKEFKNFIKSQDSDKAHKLLSFLFNKALIETWLYDQWCGIYEGKYVTENLTNPLLEWIPQMDKLIGVLDDQRKRQMKLEKSKKGPTTPIPFKLTKSKRRKMPEPQRIPMIGKARPLPATTYVPSRDAEALQWAKQSNRKRQLKTYKQASENMFECALRPPKGERAQRLFEKLQREKEEKLKFDMPKHRPLPSIYASQKEVPIRINTATILREEACYKKKALEDLKKLTALEAGNLDSSEYEKWQHEVQVKKEAEKFARIEQNHLTSQLAHEEAFLAKVAKAKENRQNAKALKAKNAQLLKDFAEEVKQKEKNNKQIVNETKQLEGRVKLAVKKLQKTKQKIASQVNDQTKEYNRRLYAEAKVERERKAELIRQIKAMENAPFSKVKFIDFSETSGAGLLTEMSILELRERLSLLRVSQEEEESKRRKAILDKKKQRERELIDKLEAIEYFRTDTEMRMKEKTIINCHRQKVDYTRLSKLNEGNKDLAALREKLRKRRDKRLSEICGENNLIRAKQGAFNEETALKREETRWQTVEKALERSSRTRDMYMNSSPAVQTGSKEYFSSTKDQGLCIL